MGKVLCDDVKWHVFVVVPEAGHMVLLEKPDVVDEALTGLLRRVAAAQPAGTRPAPPGRREPPGATASSAGPSTPGAAWARCSWRSTPS